MSVHLYNTLTRTKEEFTPLEPGKVKFYMCGPTVYDYIHIGNGRAFTVFDVIRGFLEFVGFEVTYVFNITDIDDKIINRAKEEGVPFNQISERFTKILFEDLEALGVAKASVHPKATEHVGEMVALIKTLVDEKIAYDVDGDVFFDVSKFETYGKLSGKRLDELRAGVRVSVDKNKKNPLDFALWKKHKPGEPFWDSPWGQGRPGWHIECSAMSMKYLGATFDIHAGGTDLVFPHHENEIAQSECATGENFARYWLHNGFLNIDGDKMSKSLGNFETVREVLAKYSRAVIRMFFLQKHYRSPIDLTEEGLHAASSAVKRLTTFYDNLSSLTAGLGDSQAGPAMSPGNTFVKMRSEFVDAMSDDFNSPAALSILFDMVREANKLIGKQMHSDEELLTLSYVKETVDAFDQFLGIVDRTESDFHSSDLIGTLLDLLVDVRQELRAKKEWGLSDKIRDALSEIGVAVEDKKSGPAWRKMDK